MYYLYIMVSFVKNVLFFSRWRYSCWSRSQATRGMYEIYGGCLISRYLIICSVLSGRALNGCLTGQSKITRGYDLPASVLLTHVL